MIASRQRFQFVIRNLMEIMFWISLGIGAIRAAFFMDLESGFQGPYVPLASFLYFFLPGIAFGAAVGVIQRKRSLMAVVGFFVWPLLACAGSIYFLLFDA